MTTSVLRALLVVGGVCVCLLVAGGCYRQWAHHVLRQSIRTAARDPQTGIMLGAEPIEVNRSRARACLLLHGFAGSPAEFARLPEALDEAGWDVYAPLLPGHGTRPDALEQVTAEQLYEFAEATYLKLLERYESVAIVGASMGGAIATRLASSHSPDRVVLISPYDDVAYQWYYILPARTWYRLVGRATDYVVGGERFCRVRRRDAVREIIAYRIFPVSYLRCLFELGDRAVDREALARADTMFLFLISPHDRAVSARAARRVFDLLPPERRQLKLFHRSDHQILHDYEREEAIRAIVSFLSDQPAGHALERTGEDE